MASQTGLTPQNFQDQLSLPVCTGALQPWNAESKHRFGSVPFSAIQIIETINKQRNTIETQGHANSKQLAK
jgi:hypothetical protein